jgi:hypothetical protein
MTKSVPTNQRCFNADEYRNHIAKKTNYRFVANFTLLLTLGAFRISGIEGQTK